jgi:alkanesulfonate monooxygenase SsuD/methylene tetrahydromethanopterin reductase-like flavin-dependent oxidoreductase (luciferase family)
VQQPHPPILVGGESEPALRRAARVGDGWIGLAHDAQSCAEPISRLRALLAEYERPVDGFEMVCLGRVNDRDDIERFADAGITRLLVTPWARSSEALDGVRRLAELVL